VVDRIVRDVVGPPMLVHSTSWRRDRDAVILSFVVVIAPDLVGFYGERARSTGPISPAQRRPPHRATSRSTAVIEHGLRHLAWLAEDDPVVAQTLPVRGAHPGDIRARTLRALG
jgi:hypothetical protein